MRRRVIAWGHPTLPDLDYESDDDADLRYTQYPCVDITCLTPISREAINAFLTEGAEKAE